MPYTHFRYVPTKVGTEWKAYTAGPCHWFDCHSRGRSKPCLHLMTSGELVCPWCGSDNAVSLPADNPVAQIGYQPLYRAADYRPVLVVVHDYHREQVDAIPFHRQVLIQRGNQQSDGVTITPTLSVEPRFHSTLRDRNTPVDLTRTLLRMWNIPELCEWYARTHGGSDGPVSPQPPPARTSATQTVTAPATLTKEQIEARNRAFADALRAQVAEGMGEQQERNGKPAKPKK